jgi:thiamine kinase-like enzyme
MMSPEQIALSLPIWHGTPHLSVLSGGITNVNFRVTDDSGDYVVRIGDDIPVHHISRAGELAASVAAHAAGVSPAVIHHAPRVLVIEFVHGRTMTPAEFQDAQMRHQAVDLIARAHRDIPQHLRGGAQAFWVFHVLRDYAARLLAEDHTRAADLPALMQQAHILERTLGPIDMVFGHNDLLAGNFIHDGARLWLIDWDYAGWGSPLFDLGGFAANMGLTPPQETEMLAQYFGTIPADLPRRYGAMKAAAALREALWAMVSQHHSALDFDYAAYAGTCLDSYHAAYSQFQRTP